MVVSSRPSLDIIHKGLELVFPVGKCSNRSLDIIRRGLEQLCYGVDYEFDVWIIYIGV